ncbi:MAG: hypothetical protein RL076_311 [Chloroflexota bacterium]|jgi:hypothetical protein
MDFDMQSVTALGIGILAIWLVWKVITGLVRFIAVATIVIVVAMMIMRVI